MEVRAWSGIGWWEVLLPGVGVVAVQPAGAVQRLLGPTDQQRQVTRARIVLCRAHGRALPRHLSLRRLVWGVRGAICAAELHRRGKAAPSTRQGSTSGAARPRNSPTVS